MININNTQKMKKLVAGIFVFISTVSFAQNDDANWGKDSLSCRQNVSLYSDFLGKKDYKTASKFWQKTLEFCPQYKPLLYTNGAYIYGKLADDAATPELEKQYLDTVFYSYDKLIEFFGPTPDAKQDYGVALMKYDAKNQYEKANTLLKEAVDALGEKANKSTLQYYYKSSMYMYKAKKVDEAHMVDEFFKGVGYAEKMKGGEKVVAYYEKLAEPFLSCETLIPAQQKKYDANPDDLETLKSVLNTLSKKDCFDGDLFQIASEKLLKLEPSAEGYYNYAVLMHDKEKDSEAISNIDKAIELCGDCDDKLKYIKTAAQINANGGSTTKAYSLAQDWLALDPNAGGAYLIMAKSVASSANTCATNNVEKGIVYIIAADLASKAKSVDESVAGSANKMIGGYSSRFPSKDECFFQGVEVGSSYTIGCWINKSTTVKTRD